MKQFRSTSLLAPLTLFATLLLLSSISQSSHAQDVHRAVVKAMEASFLIPTNWQLEAIEHVEQDLWDFSFNAYKPSELDEPYKTAFFARVIDNSREQTGLTSTQYIEDSLIKMKLKKPVVSDLHRSFRNGMLELAYSYVVEDAELPIKVRVVSISDEPKDRVYLLFFQSLPWNWEKDYAVGQEIIESARLQIASPQLTLVDSFLQLTSTP